MLIFHTSDIHGKLTYKKAKKILKFKEKGAILLDSGDSLSVGNFDIRFHEKTLFYMSQIGYTAGTIGNREFHPVPFLLKWKLRNANFPFLSANLLTNKKIEKVYPYRILNVNNFCVVLIGLTIPIIKGFWKKFFSFSFSDPVICGEKLAYQFSEMCDLIIFLTHIGIDKDIKLGERLKKKSIILGGHSHILTEDALKINNCIIIHSGCHAKNASLIEIENNKIRIIKEKL